MDTLLKDLRYGIRGLLKRPGFTLVALIALALGIGANTAIFSLVNAVLVQPLPFGEPDRLVWMWGNIRQGGNRASVSPLDFLDYRHQQTTFEHFAASFTRPAKAILTGAGEPERLSAAGVTGNYFQALGVNPALGRSFVLENEKPGTDQVTILSFGLWQRRFGGDPGIVDKTIVLNGESYAVLGVMPKDFNFPKSAELWIPMSFDRSPEMKQRAAHFLRPIGRLKPGVTIAQAQADTDAIAQRLEQAYPDTNTGWNLRLVSLHDQLVGNTKPTLFILLGAVGFVLLIACANVANLLLVRAAARHKEIALRTALGASRVRIMRQMITESVLLALLGGVLGAVLASWGIDLLVLVSADNLPPTAHVRIDATVLVFTLIVSLVTGVLFGLAPALRTMKLNLCDSLKEGGRSVGEGVQRNLTRSILVVVESAVAVVLLVGAGLLIRSLVSLQNVNPGFDSNNVLTMRIDVPEEKYTTADKRTNFFQQLETRVGGLAGVEGVGMISELPLTGQLNDIPYTVEGRPPTAPGQEFDDDFRRVNTQYFKALHIPLLRGRNFTDQEVTKAAKVVLISDLLAKRVFPNEEPIGHRLILGIGGEAFEIIGVVGDIRHHALENQPSPAMYLPTGAGPGMNLVIRAQGDPANLAAAVRREVKAIDPEQPVAAVKTMDEWLTTAVSGPRYRTSLLALFALVALILASTGIYGVMSYSVTQRTHEIGVRMALGARRFDVLKLVVRQGMSLVVIGVALGLIGATALTRVMSSLLFEVTPKDPLTFTAVALFLAVVALVACYIPARRATRVDPLVALRYE
ncbi:MAG TPA: ABC transporter permease [Pyrinomonadaceae bacterium]|jgi:putative ABC transport system permease protein|nr:ABC transporter permease [Pyrinomonadaceae bacterium]